MGPVPESGTGHGVEMGTDPLRMASMADPDSAVRRGRWRTAGPSRCSKNVMRINIRVGARTAAPHSPGWPAKPQPAVGERVSFSTSAARVW